MKIKSILTVSAMMLSLNGNAGVYSVTAHSRANCGNNESITWHLGNPWLWHVISYHYHDYRNPNPPFHVVDTGLSKTWRQAAVCWGEAGLRSYFYVFGYHYYVPANASYELLDVNTDASGCNIYDGWWDH